MDRFRNPNPRGESFSSLGRGGEIAGDDDIVEGHQMAVNRPDEEEQTGTSTEDVEGHGFARATEEEDVEGHGFARVNDDEDTEGHAWKR